MDPWLSVTYAKLSICVHAPAPSDAFFIYSDTHSVAETHIFNSVRNSEDFFWEWVLSENSATPEKELAFLIDTSWLVSSFDLNDTPEIERLNKDWRLAPYKLITYSEL